MRVESTPHIWSSCVRRPNFGALRARPRFLPLAGSEPLSMCVSSHEQQHRRREGDEGRRRGEEHDAGDAAGIGTEALGEHRNAARAG